MNQFDKIRHLLQADNLADANAQLAIMLCDQHVVTRMLSTITSDHDFWKYVLERHQFIITGDDVDIEQIVQPRYVNVGPVSFFLTHMHELDDVLRYSIHGGAHLKCEQLWKNCPVPMNIFVEHDLAWIEDIYGQRFVQQTAPSWYADMPITAQYYFEAHNIELTKERQDVINMLTDTAPVTYPVLNQLRTWLYGSDALQQTTFNTYIRVWVQAMSIPEVKQHLEHAFV